MLTPWSQCELARPRSVSALLHSVGSLAVTEVMRLPVQPYVCCSPRTRQWCRCAAGLHVAALQVYHQRRSQHSQCRAGAFGCVSSLGLHCQLAPCAAKSRPSWWPAVDALFTSCRTCCFRHAHACPYWSLAWVQSVAAMFHKQPLQALHTLLSHGTPAGKVAVFMAFALAQRGGSRCCPVILTRS